MAKSKWAVMSNYIAGAGTQYIAMRVLDTSQPMHSGNMEFYGQHSVDNRAVSLIVELLNEREEINASH